VVVPDVTLEVVISTVRFYTVGTFEYWLAARVSRYMALQILWVDEAHSTLFTPVCFLGIFPLVVPKTKRQHQG
jgi:hypothetical protein